MRFEKLNENKIRITLTNSDLMEEHIDSHSFMSNPIESQDLFFEMLDKAEKEIGFITKDYQIRIEALQVSGGDFVLTVTRGLPLDNSLSQRKKIHIRRKKVGLETNQAIYLFSDFDDFCYFSNFVNNSCFKVTNIAKSISLYEYKNNYYLSFVNINSNYSDFKKLFSVITEFATYVNNPDLFNRKLIEKGKLIIKNNAIKTAIQYFV